MNLNRIKRDLIITVIVELLAKIPLYGFEFLLANWLVINQYAEWVVLGLIYRMAPYAHIGALSYFNKRYPRLLGGGNIAAAENVRRHTNLTINVVLLFIFFIALLLFELGHVNATTFMVICGVLMMQLFTYCQAKVRNDGNFFAYAIGLVIFSMIQLLVAYYTVKKYGVLAGALSTFIGYLTAVLYYFLILKVEYLYRLPKRRNFNRVIKLGWAPFLLTISSFIIQISDRAALICVDDNYKLAFYGFFSIFFQIGIVAVNSLGKVLGPYVFHLSGRKKLADTLSISLGSCYIIFVLYVCMSVVLIVYGDRLIHHYFVKFSGSFLGVYNYATIGVLISLTFAFYPQLMVAGREYIIIKINLFYSLISFIGVYLLAKHFTGFVVYSFGSFLLNLLYSLIILNVIENVVGRKIHVVRFTMVFIFLTTLAVNLLHG